MLKIVAGIVIGLVVGFVVFMTLLNRLAKPIVTAIERAAFNR